MGSLRPHLVLCDAQCPCLFQFTLCDGESSAAAGKSRTASSWSFNSPYAMGSLRPSWSRRSLATRWSFNSPFAMGSLRPSGSTLPPRRPCGFNLSFAIGNLRDWTTDHYLMAESFNSLCALRSLRPRWRQHWYVEPIPFQFALCDWEPSAKNFLKKAAVATGFQFAPCDEEPAAQ